MKVHTYVRTTTEECVGRPRVNTKGGGDRRKGCGNPAIIYTKNSTFSAFSLCEHTTHQESCSRVAHKDNGTFEVALLLKSIKPQHTPTDVQEDEDCHREGCRRGKDSRASCSLAFQLLLPSHCYYWTIAKDIR